MPQQKIIFIVGPTAVGKSKAAFLLAKKINGEIVSCDSMQIYKEINIITDKPSRKVLSGVPHYLINVVSAQEEFDVARFYKLAVASIKEIHAKGKIPIVVGGSGMYMQVLLDGIFDSKEKDEKLREKLKAKAESNGNEYLYNELKKRDPEAAKKIHPNDLKRLIRALEVCMTEKKPISELQKNREGLWNKYDIKLIGLNRERAKLYEKINLRVDEMFEQGAVDEVAKLLELNLSYSAKRIIGIKEIEEYLMGKIDIEAAKEKIRMNTRRFAKRQLTWFRKEKRIEWIMVGEKDSVTDITINQILDLV